MIAFGVRCLYLEWQDAVFVPLILGLKLELMREVMWSVELTYNSIAVDLAVSIAIASWGVYLMSEGSSGEQLAGLAVVSIGTAGVMVAGVNLAPLQIERRRPRPD